MFMQFGIIMPRCTWFAFVLCMCVANTYGAEKVCDAMLDGNIVFSRNSENGSILYAMTAGGPVEIRRISHAEHRENFPPNRILDSFCGAEKSLFWELPVTHKLDGSHYMRPPYDLSKGQKYLAASVCDINNSQSRGTIEIMEYESCKRVSSILSDNSVESLAWSPSGENIVVLEYGNAKTKSGVKDAFAKWIGHRIVYKDIYLILYSANGEKVCEYIVDREVPWPRGAIRWDDE